MNTFNKNYIISISVGFAIFFLAVIIYGDFLWMGSIPRTPNEDLKRHIALANNFKCAILSGQYVPRLQLNSVSVNDIPTYQYYGFFTGMACFVPLYFCATAIHSLGIAVIISKLIGLYFLFLCCKKVGAGLIPGAISLAIYLLEPYMITNLYGRFAISEYFSQNLIPILILGILCIMKGDIKYGSLWVYISVVLLGLTHNIFFLYGVGLLLLTVIIPINTIKTRLYILIAVVSAVLSTAFQWYPAFISSKELNIEFFMKSPYYFRSLTDLLGLVGYYRPLHSGLNNISYYFTFGINTIPGLLGLYYVRNKNFKNTLIILGGLVALAAYPIIDWWAVMPKFTWALQFPYRLLSFLSVFTCIGLSMMLTKFANKYLYIFAVITCLVLSMPLLFQTYEYNEKSSDTLIAKKYSSQDYISHSDQQNCSNRILSSDGWLIQNNIFTVPENKDVVFEIKYRSYLFNKNIRLWFIKEGDTNKVPLSNIITIQAGDTSKIAMFVMQKQQSGNVTLVCSDYYVPSESQQKSEDSRRLCISIKQITLNNELIVDDVDLKPLEAKSIGPYTRKYFPGKMGWVELCGAYSMFFNPSQNGRTLIKKSSSKGNMVVFANTLEPILVKYQTPAISNYLSLLGLIVFLGVFITELLKAKKT